MPVGGTGVIVEVLVGVAVGKGIFVGVMVGVLDGVGDGPGVGVFVRVLVDVIVGGRDVFVGVGVCVAVGGVVPVGVIVGVEAGPSMYVTSSSGGRFPSRESNRTPFELSGRSTKLYVPFWVIYDVRLYCVQLPAGIESTLSMTPVLGAGRLFQVMPVSVQLLSVP